MEMNPPSVAQTMLKLIRDKVGMTAECYPQIRPYIQSAEGSLLET